MRELKTLMRRASGNAAWVQNVAALTGCTKTEAEELIEQRLAEDRQDYRPGRKKGES
ncbi:hypothetical protein [Paracoccus sp. (in: a-proteobacteria)]|uniref:hypothetical protein n=1 Tax=Paracoccus sp. TaxID=267 RepID=UPI0032200B9D